MRPEGSRTLNPTCCFQESNSPRPAVAEQAVRAAFTLPAADADALALAAAAVRTARASAGASPGEPRPLLAQACGISLCVIGVFLPLRSIHYCSSTHPKTCYKFLYNPVISLMKSKQNFLLPPMAIEG